MPFSKIKAADHYNTAEFERHENMYRFSGAAPKVFFTLPT
jgi:hypothetical protein